MNIHKETSCVPFTQWRTTTTIAADYRPLHEYSRVSQLACVYVMTQTGQSGSRLLQPLVSVMKIGTQVSCHSKLCFSLLPINQNNARNTLKCLGLSTLTYLGEVVCGFVGVKNIYINLVRRPKTMLRKENHKIWAFWWEEDFITRPMTETETEPGPSFSTHFLPLYRGMEVRFYLK